MVDLGLRPAEVGGGRWDDKSHVSMRHYYGAVGAATRKRGLERLLS